MKNAFRIFILAVLTIFANTQITTAQWSTDPGTNLMICDVTGEQVLSKIAMTSDAGCYISWFDTRTGAYNVYLQRLDPFGNKLWASDGLLISNHLQDTWLTDYDMICDQNDNAIIVFSDIRTGTLKPVAYKISPDGNFLWGPDGIDISTSDDFQPTPKVAQMSDGNYVFAWITSQDMSAIAVQKLSDDGQKLWGSVPIVIQGGTDNFSFPIPVKSDAGTAILVYTVWPNMYNTKIRAQKLDVDGQLLWGSTGISIMDNGAMGFYQVPFVSPDGNNGAFVAWYDGRVSAMMSSSFVQRISSEGNLYFPADGSEGSTNASDNKFYPQIAFNSSTQETFMFWIETDYDQIQNGIYGQKFSSTGNRLWGDNGMVFVPLSAPNTISLSDIVSFMGDNKAYVFYLNSSAGGTNSDLRGFACDADGNFVWPGDIITLSNSTLQKLQVTAAMDVYKNCKLAWEDKRSDDGGIYAQDINPSGQLGQPVIPVELTAFTASAFGNNVVLNWTTASENNNRGFEIQRSERRGQTEGLLSERSDWERIGFVGGFGTTTEPKSYSYTDNNLPSGNYFYRLKQIDFDGSYKYSNAVELGVNGPAEFSLSQNYPNPFNPTTQISYSIPKDGYVSLKVYNALGQEVAYLVKGMVKAGSHEVTFNASTISSGIYYYRIDAGDNVSVKKMILIK
ncbi:MAG TPA: T9SS type A sorting domain-containing protein [Ignavibacteriaceae bacterium]|nr:T9SS type A sorting domain-containing protein [Ignavibacteriaceae bacterium]